MKEVVEFFDLHAYNWDSYLRARDFDVGKKILARAKASRLDSVLDVACGTGVLEPLLKERGVNIITAVDISSKMGEVFSRKYPDIKFVHGDYHDSSLFLPESFSLIIIYNAFPHFEEPQKIVLSASRQLIGGGRLIIAHSMNRTELNLKHKEVGGIVGNHILVCDDEIRRMLEIAGFSDILIEDTEYFYTFAVKK